MEHEYNVGDMVSPGVLTRKELPVGSVVVFEPGGGASLFTRKGWVTGGNPIPGGGDYGDDDDWAPFKVIHVGMGEHED